MPTAYFVVDHVSDEQKTDGLVESYQMIAVQYQQEDGTLASGIRRVNFVHWPELPNPFVHEEWSEDLVFSNIYTPEEDGGPNDEEDDEEEEDEDEDDLEASGEADSYEGLEAES